MSDKGESWAYEVRIGFATEAGELEVPLPDMNAVADLVAIQMSGELDGETGLQCLFVDRARKVSEREWEGAYDWAIILDNAVADRYAGPHEAVNALPEYPDGSRVVYCPDSI